MKKESNRRYARYPSIFGEHDLLGLCDVARENGMKIISALKPDMHVCAEIGLFGTPTQMKKTDTEWQEAGNKLRRKEPGLQFGVNLKLKREHWVDSIL